MDPEPLGTARRTHFIGEINSEMHGREVTIAGWVHDIRNLGAISFILLRDKTGILQVTVLKKKNTELFERLTQLSRESVLMVKGTVNKSEKVKAGIEMLPTEAKVLSIANTPLPLGVADKVHADLDTRLNSRYIDLRKDEVRAIFIIRNTILAATRKVFEENGFTEIHTPKIVATATEGGTELFPAKYFDRDAYLNQSPQLYKQILMASSLDRVCEIGPAFRAEEHDTLRHLNEFTSIDIEMAFSDEEDAMHILELVVEKAVKMIGDHNPRELEILGVQLPDVSLPLPRLKYDECLEIVQTSGIRMQWGEDLSMEAMRILGEKYPGFYFVTHWPTEIKPFYVLPFEDDPKHCRAFDLNFSEKEVTSGAQRVHDVSLLKQRLSNQGLNVEEFEFYTKAFEFGMPPHAGWGLGVERITMILTNQTNIRECVLFPRDKHRLVP